MELRCDQQILEVNIWRRDLAAPYVGGASCAGWLGFPRHIALIKYMHYFLVVLNDSFNM